MGFNIEKVGINLWFIDVRIRKAGKELRKRETFHGNKPQADDRYIQLKRELKEGTAFLIPQSLKTFRDVLQLYRRRRETLGPIDEGRYKPLERDLGDVPISNIAERLGEYFRHLRINPCKQTGRPLSPASLNRFLALARTAFNLAVDMELLDKNPLTKARFPKHKEVARDRVLTPQEETRLLNVIATEAPHIEPVVQFALKVPCRKSELVNMRREDLNLFSEPPSIRVRNGTTKNGQGCEKPIPPEMVAYFRSLPADCPFLFYRLEKGAYAPLGDFKRAWKRCMRLAGIEGFRFHDTRHIAATALLDNGTPEQTVLQVAGWKTNMLRVYYHRDGKKSLTLVKFSSGSGLQVDTAETRAA